ncbi:MAG: DNA polymerase I [Rickettsiales bacterium]|jgi:DNA polymerase-1|nr:DNA polymerase I [Rickettsiales bacterium]
MLTLIDGNSLLFRAYYGVHSRLTRPDGVPVNAVYGFCNMLLPLLAASRAGDRVICVFDASRKTFRNEIYPMYKANRGDTPADLVAQIELTRDAARAMGMPVLCVSGIEADDVIATLATRQCGVGQTRIVSSDKDLMQLVSDCVFMYDTMKEREIRADGVLEKFGVRPDQVVDAQALIGDASDNVPGAPGIGPKKAAELINEFGSLDKIYESLDKIKSERIRDILTDNKNQIEISRQLVRLKTDAELPEFNDGDFVFDLDGFVKFTRDELGSNSLSDKAKKLFSGAPTPETIIPDTINFTYQTIKTESELDKFLVGVGDVLAIDTETTGLNQMTDRVVGISLATDKTNGVYIPLRHKSRATDLFGGDKIESGQLDIGLVYKKLLPILINPKVVKVGHNLKYDLHILANEGWAVDKIAPIDDTMLMSYVLDGMVHAHNLDDLARIYLNHENIKFASLFPDKTKNADMRFAELDISVATPYAAEDAVVCFNLYHIFCGRLDKEKKLKDVYNTCDLPLLKVLLKMERTGVLINRAGMQNLSTIFHNNMTTLESEIWAMAGREFNVASPAQLGVVLYDEMGLPRRKSTDAETLGEMEHPIAAKILEWRSVAKLAGTYADALPRQIGADGRIHTTYLQTSTNTGRLSSRDPNLQNIPIKTALGAEIRRCFVAGKGRVLVSADYSQMQLRILADLANVASWRESFANGGDIHSDTARQVFKIPGNEPVPRELRARAKTINFAVIYGMSAFGLAGQLGVSRLDAQKIIDSYWAALPEIADYFDKTKKFAMDNGFVLTPMGRKIELPELQNSRTRAYGLRAATNAPIQGAEADLMRLAMVQLEKLQSDSAKMILQVHDEIVFECDEKIADEFAARIKSVMENVATLSVPLVADTNIGKEWGK